MSYDRNTKILSGIDVPPFYHPNLTLGEFFLHYLQRDSTRIIQTNHDDGVEMSAGEMARLGCSIAAGLLKHLKTGDVVGIVCKNTTYLAALVLGSVLAGTPISAVDPVFSSKEISHFFDLTKPKMIFCDGDNMDKLKEVLRQCKIDCKLVTVDEKVAGSEYLFDIIETSGTDSQFSPRRPTTLASQNCAVILCSSGTTGHPKACMLSHQQCMTLTKAGPYYVKLFSFSKMYWVTGFTGLMQSLANNINRIITKCNFSPELFVEIIEKHRVNAIVIPPPIAALLLKSEIVKKADFSSIFVAILAGGPMDVSARKEFQKYLKVGSIVMTYSMTETGSLISSTAPFEPITNSCGKPSANIKIKIIDQDGKSLDALQIGEICVIVPYKFLGYSNNKDETEKAFDSDGWLRTGDLGYINEGGEIFVTDRQKESFDQLNFVVYPSMLESWIDKMNGVNAVCVVGIRDSADFHAAAVVVKEAGSSITEKEIVDEIAKNFLNAQQLHGGVYFVESLPMTSTGKIKRLEARAIAEKMTDQKRQ
ncbi:luciferin 4-monooxygenase-like [Bradysia coprophila]|uniref:luciferin 4-monooxygenase-like n=1 Tax=Bradysia coprophila TaxID=38358 RepID=UPI00187DD920|nr:luciferin 4-monooxygenase-like [Bradysia coprophila]